MPFRDTVKWVLSQAGVLGAYHRLRNRETLTVVMFHRVLPAGMLDQLEPDPLYTVTTEYFAAVIAFLRQHYRFVSLDDVLASRARLKPLPSRSMLVTFDDGWRDNLEHALPVLQRENVPAAIFVAVGALGQDSCWWQEALLWALRSRRARFEELWHMAAEGNAPVPDAAAKPLLELLLRYGAIDSGKRETILRPFIDELHERSRTRQMLTTADLGLLQAAGVAIGSHGTAHLPLTRIPDAAGDIGHARDWLIENAGPASVAAFSFPHGRYNARIVEAARHAQHRLMFTSDEILNDCPGGWVGGDLLGRIPIAAMAVSRSDSNVAFHRLAPALFLRERRTLDAATGQRL